MRKAFYHILFLACVFAFSSCTSEINNENILGTWKVTAVEVLPDNPNFTEKHLQRAEERIISFTYTFLEGENLKTFDGSQNIEKGGDFMLDEKRKVLTINETYNEMKLSSVLWTIEQSTSESMTLFQETPGKNATRITLTKTK